MRTSKAAGVCPRNVIPRSGATWESSWITTPGSAGLVMTSGVLISSEPVRGFANRNPGVQFAGRQIAARTSAKVQMRRKKNHVFPPRRPCA
jgi:hypothetical protein